MHHSTFFCQTKQSSEKFTPLISAAAIPFECFSTWSDAASSYRSENALPLEKENVFRSVFLCEEYLFAIQEYSEN